MVRFINKIPQSFRIKIIDFPPKEKQITNWHSYISFASGTLLAISESLPFIDNKYNGILDCLSKIQQEYKGNFK